MTSLKGARTDALRRIVFALFILEVSVGVYAQSSTVDRVEVRSYEFKEAGKNVDYADYDLINLSIEYRAHKYICAVADYVIGKEGFATDSVDFYFSVDPGSLINWFSFPLVIHYHHGPMDRLSDYTRSIRSIGVGLILNF